MSNARSIILSCSMVDRVLLFLDFDLPKDYYFHLLLCYWIF